MPILEVLFGRALNLLFSGEMAWSLWPFLRGWMSTLSHPSPLPQGDSTWPKDFADLALGVMGLQMNVKGDHPFLRGHLLP